MHFPWLLIYCVWSWLCKNEKRQTHDDEPTTLYTNLQFAQMIFAKVVCAAAAAPCSIT